MYHPALIARNTLSSHNEFRVGVYLETNKFPISQGNVQHLNDRLTLCAETIALAIAKSNKAIPLHLHMVSDSITPIHMCGICRQYASEFPSMKVTTYSADGSKKITKTVNQLLPNAYRRGTV